MGLFDMIRGNASSIDTGQVQQELGELLIEGEEVVVAFRTVRDQLVFTNKRFISIDKMGLTGKKVNYRSVPYSKITMYSAETAGSFDSDVELALWVGSNPVPLKFDIGKKTDVKPVYQALSTFILN